FLSLNKSTSYLSLYKVIKPFTHHKAYYLNRFSPFFSSCPFLKYCMSYSMSLGYIVLDSGTVKEYSHPHYLLQNSNSLFYKMVEQLGEAEVTALTERAKQVRLLQRVVIKVCLQGSQPSPDLHQVSGNKHSVPFSIRSLWRLSVMTES
ncbi:hypothetical protein FD754_025484, partial [Muntiacus muntjak]